MAPKRLPKRIEDLSYAIGKPEPHPGYFKGELVNILASVKELENGEAVREAEAQIAALETALENANTENANLKAKLNAANAEIKRFREEQKERERKERDIDPVQFQILDLLPSPSGVNWLKTNEIARALKIELDDADAYIDGLEKRNYIIFHHHDPGGGGWRRTASGNTLVLSKRRAGEEEERKAYKYPDLAGENPERVLILIAREDGLDEDAIAEKMKIRLSVIRGILHTLQDEAMATDEEKPGEAFSTSNGPVGPIWKLLRKGEDYLRERSKL